MSIELNQEAALMLAEFRNLKEAGVLNVETASQLAVRASQLVIDHHCDKNGYLRDAVTLLCEITSSDDGNIARTGVAALFPGLIERVNDSFEAGSCSLYDQVASHVIDFYRRLPAARKLDHELKRFGLMNEVDLLKRKSRILNPHTPDRNLFNSVKKAAFLSRVTIGADVAITSVMIAKLRELLPNAEIVLFGSQKLKDLYGGDSRIRIREIAYQRGGSVLNRLLSWLDVLSVVEDEQKGLEPDEFWLIDPDSRLTQLGLLPLVMGDSRYFFFESRSFQRPGAGALGELASLWVDETFGSKGSAVPFVALLPEHRAFGRAIGQKLRSVSAARLVTVSFGTGGNPNKRVTDLFEERLVRALIEDSTLIVDKGAGNEEQEQVDKIIGILREEGKTVVEVNEMNAQQPLEEETIIADVLTWNGGIGTFAALIAASDQYIGYDSAGQHIAAALGVPLITIFVNAYSQTFADRWRPYGRGDIKVLQY